MRSDRRINLFSDTQTLPTREMLAAMLGAEVGDEQRGTDPTVLRLEARVAELLGHEAAVFLPSGTMCNAIAIRLHIRPGGDEIILDEYAHPTESEAGGAAAISGASMRFLQTSTGIFDGPQLEAAIRPRDRYAPRSRLVVVEQPTNLGGGRLWMLAGIHEVLSVARRHGLRAHLDGARLMNAAVASGIAAAAYARDFDTAWIDFAKGLGCPMGAVLAGSAELIEEAWRYKQMWGGAMRQTGYVAAACLYALDHNVDRLAEDHDNARLLAEGLATLDGIEIDPATVETNIVVFGVEDARRFAGLLDEEGLEVLVVDDKRLRAVTYLGVTPQDVEDAVRRVQRALERAGNERVLPQSA
jgi:threonine aldolase